MSLFQYVTGRAAARGIVLSKQELARIVKSARRDLREGGKGAMMQGIKLALDCKALA